MNIFLDSKENPTESEQPSESEQPKKSRQPKEKQLWKGNWDHLW